MLSFADIHLTLIDCRFDSAARAARDGRAFAAFCLYRNSQRLSRCPGSASTASSADTP
jgi:hypothetical protein